MTSSPQIAASLLAASILLPAASQESATQGGEKPVLVIESFRAAKGFVFDVTPITLVGTVRNVGKAPLPADIARGKLISLASLEFTAGDTLPKLPELAPGASVSYRWQVTPTRAEGPLAASFAITAPNQPITVRAFSIPRLASAPPPESSGVARTPAASMDAGVTVLENDRIRARIVQDISRDPIVLYSRRTPGGWRQVGTGVPLIEVDSAEPGQRSWWEQLNVEETRLSQTAVEAAVRLRGMIGLKWQAEIDLKLRAGSAALDAEVTLTALRSVTPLGIRLIPFLAGDGSFGSTVTETLDPAQGGPVAHRAVRWGEITVGTVRRNEPPLPGWRGLDTPSVELADYRLIAVEWIPSEVGPRLARGSTVRLRNRIYALSPSASVRDAYSVAPPESVTQQNVNGRL